MVLGVSVIAHPARFISVLLVAVVILLPFSVAAGLSVSSIRPAIPGPSHGMPEAPTTLHSSTPGAPASFAVVFQQAGLSAGTWWTIVLAGTSRSTQSGDFGIAFSEPNGTYSFEASAVGYAADPSSGTAVVSGRSIDEGIVFAPPGSLFHVTFEETGLPLASAWSVTLNGTVGSSNSSTITFGETNGSYAYTISGGTSYRLVSSVPGSPLTVSGANVSVALVFAPAYSVTFMERGMPPRAGGGVAFGGGATTPFASGGTVAFVGLVNGTYPYTVAAGTNYRLESSTPSSPLTVNGTNVSVTVVFEAVYAVTFTELALPRGTQWSVTMNGSQQVSTGTTVAFAGVTNGTDAFTTSTTSSAWQTTEQTGVVTIVGSNPVVPVPFEYAYPVTFEAGGLPTGVEWYVNLTASFSAPVSLHVRAAALHPVVYSFTSGAPTLVFSLPNGSYTYTVASNSGSWTPPTSNRSLTVAGASPAVQSIQPLGLVPGQNSVTQFVLWAVVTVTIVAAVAIASIGYRTYVLRPAPSEGADTVDELYQSYDLVTEVDPATADDNPDTLDDIF